MKKRIVIIVCCVAFLLVMAMVVMPYTAKKRQEKERLEQFNEATEICVNVATKYGLTDAHISISYDNNRVTLFAKNIDELSYNDMVCIYDEINDELYPSLYFNSISYRFKIGLDEGQTKVYEYDKLVHTEGEKRSLEDRLNALDSDISEEEKGYAWAVAQSEVKSRLKSPSTAKFPTYNHATITKNGSIFTVIGYVDAQNSYGATLRTSFTVSFKKTGSESYIVNSVNISD